LVDNSTRRKMDEMLKTWKEPVPGSMDTRPVFPPEITRPIENALIKARTSALQQEQLRNQQQGFGRGRGIAAPYRHTPTPPTTSHPPTQAPSGYPANYTQQPYPQASGGQQPYPSGGNQQYPPNGQLHPASSQQYLPNSLEYSSSNNQQYLPLNNQSYPPDNVQYPHTSGQQYVNLANGKDSHGLPAVSIQHTIIAELY
jgi:pre-mRNA cleavage complex 2 protein Pcf11